MAAIQYGSLYESVSDEDLQKGREEFASLSGEALAQKSNEYANLLAMWNAKIGRDVFPAREDKPAIHAALAFYQASKAA